ncbi:hypothetical protein FRC10_001015, partial [Ceratobasidium sp. 414]
MLRIRSPLITSTITSPGKPYDPDFGLPAGPEDAPPQEHPLFQFPLDEDAEPNLDNDPDKEVDQGGGCAAFRKPDLIRNAYADTYVWKTLYGTTTRAIKHQLKAAKRTLSSHPDINPNDLARMAQSISTVEWRLGLDAAVVDVILLPTSLMLRAWVVITLAALG